MKYLLLILTQVSMSGHSLSQVLPNLSDRLHYSLNLLKYLLLVSLLLHSQKQTSHSLSLLNPTTNHYLYSTVPMLHYSTANSSSLLILHSPNSVLPLHSIPIPALNLPLS